MKLVVGATGTLGMEICRLLKDDGKLVKALVRENSNPTRVDELWQMGVEQVRGDLRYPGSLESAFEGVSAVIVTVSSIGHAYKPGENDIHTVDRTGIMNLIDKAAAAGVRKFIYTSFSGQIDLDFPLMHAKRWVEHHLQISGMDYTILRPSYFMEVWLTVAVGFDPLNGKVQIFGEGTKSVSYISYKDVARFATECLEHPAARNAILELGGPDKVSQLEAVTIYEEVIGKKVEVQHVPEAALQEKMSAATDDMEKTFAGLQLSLAQGDPIDMRAVLENFTIPLTPVSAFAKTTLS